MALVLGLPFSLAWLEVSRSNLAKISDNGEVIKNDAGKIMKPKGWTAPDIRSLIKRQM
jgi:predicted HAD superfamily Cof-like phosphohydrolase